MSQKCLNWAVTKFAPRQRIRPKARRARDDPATQTAVVLSCSRRLVSLTVPEQPRRFDREKDCGAYPRIASVFEIAQGPILSLRCTILPVLVKEHRQSWSWNGNRRTEAGSDKTRRTGDATEPHFVCSSPASLFINAEKAPSDRVKRARRRFATKPTVQRERPARGQRIKNTHLGGTRIHPAGSNERCGARPRRN